MAAQLEVTIMGRVIEVQQYAFRFKVECPDLGKINCHSSTYKPCQEGDGIYGFAVFVPEENTYRFTRDPFVQMPVDAENIKLCFIQYVKSIL